MMKKHSTRRNPMLAKVDAEFAQRELDKLAQDRKTGQFYDPKAAFDNLMNTPEVLASLKRLAVR